MKWKKRSQALIGETNAESCVVYNGRESQANNSNRWRRIMYELKTFRGVYYYKWLFFYAHSETEDNAAGALCVWLYRIELKGVCRRKGIKSGDGIERR